jgi:hypothetical protein
VSLEGLGSFHSLRSGSGEDISRREGSRLGAGYLWPRMEPVPPICWKELGPLRKGRDGEGKAAGSESEELV